MRTSIVHSFDAEDGGSLDPDRVGEAINLLSGSVDRATRDAVESGVRSPEGLSEADHAGLRAARKIRGGAFTEADVRAFRAYVGTLAGRHRASADALEAEGATAAFVSGVRATADLAERIADDFVRAFEAARLREG